ncbi:hypothetical protein BLNAU_6243 [Blattamonas nauphoetae]|uniref:Uncharacterized protein n=1 Tax=Blattamonas nauphoetae TaxID=2049346 RepID=A0ABQ9Y4R5_9EUKA|nr:hypothetical protein BLNAU_6243 [Blattamonas nauphoetae]
MYINSNRKTRAETAKGTWIGDNLPTQVSPTTQKIAETVGEICIIKRDGEYVESTCDHKKPIRIETSSEDTGYIPEEHNPSDDASDSNLYCSCSSDDLVDLNQKKDPDFVPSRRIAQPFHTIVDKTQLKHFLKSIRDGSILERGRDELHLI